MLVVVSPGEKQMYQAALSPLLGDWAERVPWEGPACGVPHEGQPGPDRVPTGNGAHWREPHRGAGGHPAQPL